MALRKADWLFKGDGRRPSGGPAAVRPRGAGPYTFTHDVAGRDVTTTVTPPYQLVWQVRGSLDAVDPDGHETIIGLLDYRTGKALYDVRDDLTGVLPGAGGTSPEPAPSLPATPVTVMAGLPSPLSQPRSSTAATSPRCCIWSSRSSWRRSSTC